MLDQIHPCLVLYALFDLSLALFPGIWYLIFDTCIERQSVEKERKGRQYKPVNNLPMSNGVDFCAVADCNLFGIASAMEFLAGFECSSGGILLFLLYTARRSCFDAMAL